MDKKSFRIASYMAMIHIFFYKYSRRSWNRIQ